MDGWENAWPEPKGGRPKKEKKGGDGKAPGYIEADKGKIDKRTFEKLCGMLLTKKELADFFGVALANLEAFCRDAYSMSFADVYDVYSADGKARIRQMQMRLAETNPTMAIWLGKQYLGQKEGLSVAMEPISVVSNVPKADEKEGASLSSPMGNAPKDMGAEGAKPEGPKGE